MSIFEKLSQKERDAIENYINDYGGQDGCELPRGMEASLDYVLRFWDREKAPFAKMFGDKLIVSRDICYNRPLDMIVEDIEDLLNYQPEGTTFCTVWDRMIEDNCGEYQYCWSDDYDEEKQTLRSNFFALMDPYYLAKNIYEGESFSFFDEEKNKKIVIDQGCKIMKAIGKVVKSKHIPEEVFEKFRIAHSMCLNQKKMKGRLCLSIHPLDFMTMSDNECNWQSCMNWMDGGEYRQGTVEMMNSPCVVMAYLDADNEDFTAGGIYWSNKKWRQLFVVSPKVIMGIKPYPYYSDECERISLCWLREMAENSGFGHYMDEIQKLNNNEASPLTDGRTVYFSFNMHHMYNDIYRNHRAFVSADEKFERIENLMLSGKTECVCCGEDFTQNRGDIDVSCVSCDSCNHIIVCSGCGDRVDYSCANELDGECYCSWCYERYAKTCPCCEEVHHVDHFNNVFITFDNEVVEEDSPCVDICDDCTFSYASPLGRAIHVQRPGEYYSWCGNDLAVNPKNFKSQDLWGLFFDNDIELADFVKNRYRKVEEQ